MNDNYSRRADSEAQLETKRAHSLQIQCYKTENKIFKNFKV